MNANLPPPWCRTRDAAEMERERAHLEAMQKREREAMAAGFQCRPKVERPAEAERLLQWVDDQGRLDARDAFDFREMHANYKARVAVTGAAGPDNRSRDRWRRVPTLRKAR